MADLTPEARIQRAEQVVREQRNHKASDDPSCGLSTENRVLTQQLVRLQRAVMGEDRSS